MSFGTYRLEPGDKATEITAYTTQGVIRGDLVTREAIRVSTWLRTPGLPDYAGMYNVKMIRGVGAGEAQAIELDEFHAPVNQIIALHLTPPNEEAIEHDPMELNRKMEPVTAISGPFRFDGAIRMPQHLNLTKQMALMRDPFLSLFDVTILSSLEPQKKTKVPMVVIRPAAFGFAPRGG